MYNRTSHLMKGKFKEYLLPCVLMSVAMQFGSIVNGIFVGNILGTNALAAVNICFPIMIAYNVPFILFGAGGSVVVSIAKGRRENRKADVIFTLSMIVMAVISLLIAVWGVFYSNALAGMLTGYGELQPLVADFLYVVLVGSPVLIIGVGFTYFMTADNHPTLGSAYFIFANIINLILDYILLTYTDLGIRAAAISTILGYLAGYGVIGIYLLSKKRSLSFCAVTGRDIHSLKEVAQTGSPESIVTILLCLKDLTINTLLVNTLGSFAVVIYSVCVNCADIVGLVITGITEVMRPMIGSLYGEEDFVGVKIVFGMIIRCDLAFMGLCFAAFELFPGFFVGMFGVEAGPGLESAKTALRIFSLSLSFFLLNTLAITYYQTIQESKLSGLISFVQGYIIVIPALLVLIQFMGINGIWIAIILNETITTLFAFCAAKRQAWLSGTHKDGLWLLPRPAESLKELDMSISGKLEDAMGVSAKIIEFCRESGLSDKQAHALGVAAEEMTVNIIKHGLKNQKSRYIDVNIKRLADKTILRIRDDGSNFDPTEYSVTEKSPFITTGIALVKKLTREITYSRVLNFNSTIIKL